MKILCGVHVPVNGWMYIGYGLRHCLQQVHLRYLGQWPVAHCLHLMFPLQLIKQQAVHFPLFAIHLCCAIEINDHAYTQVVLVYSIMLSESL